MLKTIRSSRPGIPVFCITPIFSTREFYQEKYAKLSCDLRKIMQQVAGEKIESGDKNIFLIEGTKLLGQKDSDCFAEAVHPTDLGFQRIADRLGPMIEKAVRNTTNANP